MFALTGYVHVSNGIDQQWALDKILLEVGTARSGLLSPWHPFLPVDLCRLLAIGDPVWVCARVGGAGEKKKNLAQTVRRAIGPRHGEDLVGSALGDSGRGLTESLVL